MSDLKIFAKTVEESAAAQIDLLLAQEPFKDCKVRIMPDVHAGAGCVIGFTANLGDKVIPNIVGVDIGCGMYVVPLGKIAVNYERLDQTIRSRIPAGMAVNNTPVRPLYLDSLACYDHLRNIDWLKNSMRSLGGGNHFIEVDEDEAGEKYLVIHTGSRNLGKQVAEIYQDLAIRTLHNSADERKAIIQRLKETGHEREIEAALKAFKRYSKNDIPDDLCYLEGENRLNYLHDMRQCQVFATENRELIARCICDAMRWIVSPESFHSVHNYIDDDNMVRKGAISAKAGQPLIIPINMRDGCILGEGLGNEDWNCSAPHGAGRVMSRAEARKNISLAEYTDCMKGVYTTSVGSSTIDEAPQAYKPLDEIVSCISDTVRIKKIIKPVYNFKAGD